MGSVNNSIQPNTRVKPALKSTATSTVSSSESPAKTAIPADQLQLQSATPVPPHGEAMKSHYQQVQKHLDSYRQKAKDSSLTSDQQHQAYLQMSRDILAESDRVTDHKGLTIEEKSTFFDYASRVRMGAFSQSLNTTEIAKNAQQLTQLVATTQAEVQKTPTEKAVAGQISHYDLGNHQRATTYGLRVEKEFKPLAESKGSIPIDGLVNLDYTLLKITPVVATNVGFGSHSFNVSPGAGLKLQLGLGETLNVYTSGMGTANVGVLGGDFTAGVGLRGAVGSELGPLYLECFSEKATNYSARGVAAGLRLIW